MAGRNEAKIKFIAETSEFNEQIKRANQSMTELRSELKLSQTQFKDNESSVEALTAKKKILQEQLTASAEKVEALRKKLEKAKEIYGENSDEVSKLKTQLNKAETQYAQLENAVDDCSNELDDQKKDADKARKALDDLTSSVDKGNDGFTVMKGVIADLAADGIRKLVDGLKEAAKYSMQVGMDFESGMSKVQATSGASAAEMVQLETKAKKMGATTKFSASEAAEAFNYMAMAGWKTGDMLDGIEGVLSLAAAANADLGEASDIVTDALTAMGYAAKDAGRLADVMAAASSNANTNVSLMGDTFKYAAPIVGTFGYSMEDLAVATGLMANAGIKGEMAGTQLRAGMLRLTKPTKDMQGVMDAYGLSITNSDGSMKSLMEVMQMYRSKLGGLTEAEQARTAAVLFGTEAASGWLSIINASDEDFNNLTEAIYNSEGAAKEMSDVMQNNLQGDLTIMKSALEGVGIAAYQGFSSPLRQAVQSVSAELSSYDVAKLINGISFEIGQLASKVASALPGIMSTVVNVIQAIVDNIDSIVAGVKAFIITWATVKGLSIAISIGGVITKIAALVSGLISGTITIGGVTTALGGMSAALTAATGGISLVVAGLAFLVTKLFNAKSSTEAYSEAAAQNANVLTEFKYSLDNLSPTLASTNGLLTASGKTMSQLDQTISETETAITTILSTALSEQRTLRENELQEIEQYNQRMAELQAEKLQVYRDQQNAILLQIKNEGETLTQAAAAQYIVNLREAINQSNSAAEGGYKARLIEIENFHKTQGTIDSEAYYNDLTAAKEAYDKEIAENESYNAKALGIIADSAAEWVGTEADKWATILDESGKSKKKYAQNLSELELENSKAFLQMYVEAKTGGAKVSAETEQLAKDMLGAFDDLPKDMDEVGKETLLGLIGGMEDKIPGLENTADMTANEIVDVLKKELQVQSPSKVTKQIGGYVAEGLAVGMEEKKGTLGSRIASFAGGLISKMRSAFGVASPSKVTAEIGGYLSEGLGVGIEENEDAAIEPMQGLVDKIKGVDVASEWAKLSGAGGSLNYDVSAQLGDYVSSAIDSNSPYALLGSLIDAVEDLANRAINLDIDGVRFATATAGASDNVSGNRLNLKARGLAL